MSTAETLTAPIRMKVAAVIGFLVFVEFTSGFIQGYYYPLVAAIADHHQVNDAEVTWFATLQTLAAAVCVPLLSKLGDIFGHRRLLRIAIIAVFVGTLLIALAPNFATVLVGRVIMGPLAVWLPLEIALVHNRIQGGQARKAIGLLVSSLTVGIFVGGLAAGGVSTVSPALVITLLVPVVIVAACVVIVFTLVPEVTLRKPTKIDGPGFALLALFMITLLSGLRAAQSSGLSHISTILLLIASAAVLAVFVWWERRTPHPAVSITMLTSRTLWPVYVTAFMFGMALFGTQTIVTTFLSADPEIHGYGFAFAPGAVSLFTAGATLVSAVATATFAYLAKPIGMRGVLLLAVACAIVANVLLASSWGSLALVCIAFAINGIGTGLMLSALPALVSEVAPAGDTGIATGVYNSLRTLGGAVAGAVFGVVLASFVAPATGAATIGGYATVWLVCAGCFVLAFCALLALRSPAPHVAAEEGRAA